MVLKPQQQPPQQQQPSAFFPVEFARVRPQYSAGASQPPTPGANLQNVGPWLAASPPMAQRQVLQAAEDRAMGGDLTNTSAFAGQQWQAAGTPAAAPGASPAAGPSTDSVGASFSVPSGSSAAARGPTWTFGALEPLSLPVGSTMCDHALFPPVSPWDITPLAQHSPVVMSPLGLIPSLKSPGPLGTPVGTTSAGPAGFFILRGPSPAFLPCAAEAVSAAPQQPLPPQHQQQQQQQPLPQQRPAAQPQQRQGTAVAKAKAKVRTIGRL